MSALQTRGRPYLSSGGIDVVSTAETRRLLGLEKPTIMRAVFVDAVHALLAGTCDAATKARAEMAAAKRLMPPGMAEILPHLGIDPVGMMALALANETHLLSVHMDGQSIAWLDFDSHDMFAILLGDAQNLAIHWCEDHVLMPTIPDTVMTALVGRPLADVLSHPILDPFALTIVEARSCWDDDRFMEIRTSLHAAGDLTGDMLLARARAVADRFRDLGLDVEGLDFCLIGGVDPFLVMPAQRHLEEPHPTRIAINPDLVGRLPSGDLQQRILGLLPEWRDQR